MSFVVIFGFIAIVGFASFPQSYTPAVVEVVKGVEESSGPTKITNVTNVTNVANLIEEVAEEVHHEEEIPVPEVVIPVPEVVITPDEVAPVEVGIAEKDQDEAVVISEPEVSNVETAPVLETPEVQVDEVVVAENFPEFEPSPCLAAPSDDPSPSPPAVPVLVDRPDAVFAPSPSAELPKPVESEVVSHNVPWEDWDWNDYGVYVKPRPWYMRALSWATAFLGISHRDGTVTWRDENGKDLVLVDSSQLLSFLNSKLNNTIADLEAQFSSSLRDLEGDLAEGVSNLRREVNAAIVLAQRDLRSTRSRGTIRASQSVLEMLRRLDDNLADLSLTRGNASLVLTNVSQEIKSLWEAAALGAGDEVYALVERLEARVEDLLQKAAQEVFVSVLRVEDTLTEAMAGVSEVRLGIGLIICFLALSRSLSLSRVFPI